MTGELCSSLETEAKVAVGFYGDEERPQLFRLVRGWQNRVHLLLRQRLKVKIFRCLQFMNRHVWGAHEGFAVVENPGRLFLDVGDRNDVKAHHAPYTILHGPLFPPVQQAMFMVEIDGVRVLYTGDYSREEDRHLMSAEVPSQRPEVLVVEST